jgi:ribonuclease P protein component
MRNRHEAHFPAKHTPPGSQARIPCTYVHPRWPGHFEVSPRQGPAPSQRLIGRISSRSAFQTIRRLGRHVRSGPLSCTMMLDPSLTQPHVGYVLGRSYGNAVSRNRLRRQLREIVKDREAQMQPGYYVFGASPRARSAAHADLVRAIDGLLVKCAQPTARGPVTTEVVS